MIGTIAAPTFGMRKSVAAASLYRGLAGRFRAFDRSSGEPLCADEISHSSQKKRIRKYHGERADATDIFAPQPDNTGSRMAAAGTVDMGPQLGGWGCAGEFDVGQVVTEQKS